MTSATFFPHGRTARGDFILFFFSLWAFPTLQHVWACCFLCIVTEIELAGHQGC